MTNIHHHVLRVFPLIANDEGKQQCAAFWNAFTEEFEGETRFTFAKLMLTCPSDAPIGNPIETIDQDDVVQGSFETSGGVPEGFFDAAAEKYPAIALITETEGPGFCSGKVFARGTLADSYYDEVDGEGEGFEDDDVVSSTHAELTEESL